MRALTKLLQVGGPALGAPFPKARAERMSASESEAVRQLGWLLESRNGFEGFEGALHVFPSTDGRGRMVLEEWNAPNLWKHEYGDDAVSEALFFAEDIFGGQFGITEDEVVSLDPETGTFRKIAPDLEGWAGSILSEMEELTGYPLAHAWQERHGRIPDGKRLMPGVPFVAGGKYEVANLAAIDRVEAMAFRGVLARQIRDLPDGAEIEFVFRK